MYLNLFYACFCICLCINDDSNEWNFDDSDDDSGGDVDDEDDDGDGDGDDERWFSGWHGGGSTLGTDLVAHDFSPQIMMTIRVMIKVIMLMFMMMFMMMLMMMMNFEFLTFVICIWDLILNGLNICYLERLYKTYLQIMSENFWDIMSAYSRVCHHEATFSKILAWHCSVQIGLQTFLAAH